MGLSHILNVILNVSFRILKPVLHETIEKERKVEKERGVTGHSVNPVTQNALEEDAPAENKHTHTPGDGRDTNMESRLTSDLIPPLLSVQQR